MKRTTTGWRQCPVQCSRWRNTLCFGLRYGACSPWCKMIGTILHQCPLCKRHMLYSKVTCRRLPVESCQMKWPASPSAHVATLLVVSLATICISANRPNFGRLLMNASLTKTQRIPHWIQSTGLTLSFIYNGPSMRPAFRPGDMLYVRPAVRDVSAGNVIVFTDTHQGCIVHRVISVAGTGWVTRGDNNRLTDVLPVTPERLIGRVEMAEFQGCFRTISGGSRGLWSARTLWAARWVNGWLRRILRKPYHALRSSVPVCRFLSRRFSHHLRVVRLYNSGGLLIKTTYKGRTVARWQPRQKRFECRQPFDLLIAPPTEFSTPWKSNHPDKNFSAF